MLTKLSLPGRSNARIAFLACCLMAFTAASQSPTITYLGHACFRIVSSRNTAVVIDPYNSHRWLGYTFPQDVKADAVLVTHPHYDHNADYYFPNTPSLQRPGKYQIGDIAIEGIKGHHAGPYGKEFGQRNTIFVITVDGKRIAHLGDNGPLTPEVAAAIGRVDALMIPVDAQEHILKYAEVERILEQVRPKIVMPMHFKIDGLSTDDPKFSLGTPDMWLGSRKEELFENATSFQPRTRDDRPRVIVVMEPSRGIRRWSAGFQDALRLSQGSIDERREAVRKAPQSILMWYRLAEMQAAAWPEAARTLEEGLARAWPDDYEHTEKARLLLSAHYMRLGRPVAFTPLWPPRN